MNRVIIFEGPDGTGKTTIAKALSEKMKIPYFKHNSEHDNWRQGQFKTALEFDQPFMQQYLKQTKSDLVWDRAYPSEWVYSKVFCRNTNTMLLERLDAEYSKMDAWIVIPLRKNYENNKVDEVVTKDKLYELHRVYNDFCEWTACNTLRIYVDTFDNNLERELFAINGSLKFPTYFRNNIIVEGR